MRFLNLRSFIGSQIPGESVGSLVKLLTLAHKVVCVSVLLLGLNASV